MTGSDLPHLLSNRHVLVSSATDDLSIIQPGRLDGGVASDLIATLCFRPEFQRDGTDRVDAAVAVIDSAVTPDWPEIPGIGSVTGITDVDDLIKVSKRGRTTNVTHGRVTAFDLSRTVRYPGIGDIKFVGQIEVSCESESFSKAGDSGSLVVAENGEAIGLLFAGTEVGGLHNTGATYVNPIADVFGALGCTGFWS